MGWENELIQALEKEIETDNSESFYDNSFYNDHEKYRNVYNFLGELIYVSFNPKSVIDLGCGAAFLLERLKALGVKKVCGIDGSESAKNSWPEHMKDVLKVQDLLKFDSKERYDVAVCMEVAEHIPGDKASRIVKRVTDSAGQYVWWTAAQPGQGGTGHINCQSICYWVRQFESCKFIPLWEYGYNAKMEMLKIKEIHSYPWFRDNLIVFKRVGR